MISSSNTNDELRHQSSKINPPTFDNLPSEVKTIILKQAPDLKTFQNLVHASPSYHAVYLTARKQILTTMALRQLAVRAIDFFQPSSRLEVYVKGGPPGIAKTVKSAIESCIQRHQKGEHKKALSIEHCVALLSIQHARFWPGESEDYHDSRVFAQPEENGETQRVYGYGFDSYDQDAVCYCYPCVIEAWRTEPGRASVVWLDIRGLWDLEE